MSVHLVVSLTASVGAGGVMGLSNQSSEAAKSGTGGWLEGVTYQAGLSGGSWATGTSIVNNYTLPTDLVRNVSCELPLVLIF